jgi:ribosomal protein L11 methyltransferase
MRTWPALRVSGLAAPLPDTEVCAGDLLHAALADHPIAAVEEISPDQWHVYFATSDDRRAAADMVSSLFPAVSMTLADVPDDDWAAKSQASLRAIRAGGVIVAPPWDVSLAADARHVIIQPSMGFGTGHHATTRLCLQALQDLPLHGRRVLDVGTGSGVLAIAASLLGASEVVGIDDDPDAVEAARNNLGLNAGAAARFDVVDLRAFEELAFDVVTANLTGGLLAATARRLENLTRPAGSLILSGLMVSEAEDVLRAFTGCAVIRRANEDEWVSVTLAREIAA